MKKFRFALCAFAALALMASCQKSEKEEKEPDTTPGALLSFAFLAEDNADYISEDLVADEISPLMIFRVEDGGSGKKLVATLSAEERDHIYVNETKVANGGKVTVDATYPIDIIVTDTISNVSTAYEVKVGKILGLVATKVAEYATGSDKGSISSKYLYMKVNPQDGLPYFFATIGGGSYDNGALLKYDGSAISIVDTLHIESAANVNTAVMAISPDNVPYVLFKGGVSSSTFSLAKFENSQLEMVSNEAIPNVSLCPPTLFFNQSTKQPIIWSTDASNKKKFGKRVLLMSEYNGSEWAYSSPDAFGGNKYWYTDGVVVDGKYYFVSSTMNGPHYIGSVDGNTVSVTNSEFIPEGETIGTPYNLTVRKDSKNTVYALICSYTQGAMQLYTLNVEDGSLTPYGSSFSMEVKSTSSDLMTFAINPTTDQFVALKQNMDSKIPEFSFMDANGAWEDFVACGEEVPTTNLFIDYTADGVGYASFATETGIKLYQIGLEDDILPE